MSTDIDEEMLRHMAFSAERTARITEVSPSQLARWDRDGFYPAAFHDPRMYTFRQLAELRVLAKLRNVHNIPWPDLVAWKEWMARSPGEGWTTQRFWVEGKVLHFDDPQTKRKLSTKPFGQATMPVTNMTDVVNDTRARIIECAKRRPRDIGRVERKRGVQNGQPVIAGTRLLVSTIVAHHLVGKTVEEIVKLFPVATERDVREAIAYDAKHNGRANKPDAPMHSVRR